MCKLEWYASRWVTSIKVRYHRQRNCLHIGIKALLSKTRGKDFLSGGTDFISCGNDFLPCRILLSCGNDLLTCRNELLACGNELQSCGYDFLTCGNNLLSCGYNFLTCGNELVSRGNNDLLVCGNDSQTDRKTVLPGHRRFQKNFSCYENMSVQNFGPHCENQMAAIADCWQIIKML